MNYSYVTLLTDDSYFRGVIVLNETLKRVKSKYNLICYYTENVNTSNINLLSQQYKIECRLINTLQFSDELYQKNRKINEHLAKLWQLMPTKFELFNLDSIDKLIYLDADTIVLNNIDSLFANEETCMAVIDGEYNNISYNGKSFINCGVMFIKPNKTVYNELVNLVQDESYLSTISSFMNSGFVTEQDVLNDYFKFTDNKHLLLDKHYNIFAPYSREDQFDDILTNGKVVHFVGHKYWQINDNKSICNEYLDMRLYKYAYTILSYVIQTKKPIKWNSKRDLAALTNLYNNVNIFKESKDYQFFKVKEDTKMKLCVYAICKNEIKFVDQWLDNMSEADSIVVLDTGSTDGTYEKLKADPRVTRVEQQVINPWRFDVARNESMKLIPDDADILVCTDFDELFTKGWAEEIKKAWSSNSSANRVHYKFAWSHTPVGEPSDVFMYDKVHNRDFHWKFPVHEVLWPNDETIKPIFAEANPSLMLHHYPDKTKSRKFYFDLLQLTCEENPTDCHPRMLLAREYLLNSDFEHALENYLAVLKMPDVDAPEKRLVLLESLGRCADCYKILKNYDEAIWYCQEFIKENATYREPYFIMAEVYNEMKMYTLAEAMVLAGIKYSTRKNDWIERAPTWINWADDILSIAYYNMKKPALAVKHGKEALKHNPEDKRLKNNYVAYLESYATLLEKKVVEQKANTKTKEA